MRRLKVRKMRLNVRKMRPLNVRKMRQLNVREIQQLNVRKNTLNVRKMRLKWDQYQYLGRRRYETEPFKFTKKRLI